MHCLYVTHKLSKEYNVGLQCSLFNDINKKCKTYSCIEVYLNLLQVAGDKNIISRDVLPTTLAD